MDYALLALVDVFPHPAALIPVHTYRNRRPRTRSSNYRDCDLNGVPTVFFFSRLTDYFGARWVYVTGISACVPCFSLFPVINHLARNSIERSGGMRMDVSCGLVTGVAVSFGFLPVLRYARLEIFGLPVDLIPFFVPFGRGVHPHRCRRTQWSVSRSYKWTRLSLRN